MNREAVIYAAGLVEGEGSFSIQRVKGRGFPQFSVTMADREPLERLCAAFPFLRIRGPYRRPGKPLFTVASVKFEHVQAVAAALWPWLSPRRQKQIHDTFTEYHTQPGRKNRAPSATM